MPVAVFALGLTVFSLGTTEFMIAGLLPELADAFAVSLPRAGLLISLLPSASPSVPRIRCRPCWWSSASERSWAASPAAGWPTAR
jgi:hypothetical protein